jgi:hypothetical protein
MISLQLLRLSLCQPELTRHGRTSSEVSVYVLLKKFARAAQVAAWQVAVQLTAPAAAVDDNTKPGQADGTGDKA